MALTRNCSKFLFFAKQQGVTFERTLTLGRLNLYASPTDIAKDLAFFKSERSIDSVEFSDGYSEPLFRLLGAHVTDSMDFSDYEKATVIHDLNKPIPENLKNKYSAIVDGGTIEDVFNFPIAIKNCMEMLELGGHYIGITPANNNMGHGFYQFSPELFYNIFNASNGFVVKKMMLVAHNEGSHQSNWYEVLDPAKAKTRVTLVNSKPTYLMVLAQKTAEVPVFQTTPQQSDYQTLWAIRKSLNEGRVMENESRLKFLYRKFTPRPLKIFLRNVYDLFTRETVEDEDLGNINAEHFRKVDIPQY